MAEGSDSISANTKTSFSPSAFYQKNLSNATLQSKNHPATALSGYSTHLNSYLSRLNGTILDQCNLLLTPLHTTFNCPANPTHSPHHHRRPLSGLGGRGSILEYLN
ncbi:hypothetical protein HELRODRAFT_177568 [Helobdella robusta]|uniref:Uncharacterized protein n=1 Tax=Helobdella robusta TaxID=6412 RepID=T1FBW0_HELRO|nr:hypothetical protein HELRODRAFT_177568 [Helobdella robusta]ESN97911.1 hypothetical protein HELRODRAFT_177568 [Helobdella robusta]